MAKRLFLKTYYKKFLKTLKKTTALRRFRTLLLRSTFARQTHFNTTERNYCLLKTWARRITKCLLLQPANKPRSHARAARERRRGSKGRGKKRPQDNNCYCPLILIKLPFLKKNWKTLNFFEFLNYKLQISKLAGTSCYIFLLFFFVTWHVHGFCFGDSR